MRAGLAQQFRPAAAKSTGRIVIGIVLLVVVGAAGILVAAVAWLPREIRYEVTADALTVRLRAGVWRVGRVVPLAAITAVRPLELGRGRRLVGTAMPGYCVGRFSYDDLGAVWQATSCGRSVVRIEAAGETLPVLVAPADRDAFLAALSSRQPGSFAPAPFPPAPGWTWVQLALLAPLLVVPMLVATFFLAPGRLRYEVGQGELVVRTMMGARRFPLAGATARRCTPGRVAKLAGNGLPGYYTGWFYLDGGRARVYATRLADGVLVEGPARVFVTPAVVEPFLAALRANGATPA
jgi:hypothetical protein